MSIEYKVKRDESKAVVSVDLDALDLYKKTRAKQRKDDALLKNVELLLRKVETLEKRIAELEQQIDGN